MKAANSLIGLEGQYKKAPRTWILKLLALLAVMILIAWSGQDMNNPAIKSNSAKVAESIIRGILNPDWSLFGLTTTGIPYLLLETICIAFLGTLIGAIFAIPLAFLASENVVGKVVAYITRMVIMAIRTIPAFIYGLMFIRATGPGPFAGLLTMGLSSIGMVARLYVESIEDLDTRILESLDAAGCTSFQKIRYGVIPQLISNFMSTAIYRFDINLRDATVLGLVGAGGIGTPLIFAMSTYKWNQAGAMLLGLVIIVFLVEYISTHLRVKLARG